MTAGPERKSLPRKLKGVPLLPLRRDFLFPHTLLPLWLTDPARSALLHEVHTGRRLVVATTEAVHRCLERGWPVGDGACACVAEVVTARRTADGLAVCLLRGLARVSVEKTQGTPEGPLLVTARLFPDFYPKRPAIDRAHRAFELCSLFRQLVSELIGEPSLVRMLEHELPLGHLCDRLAAGLELRSSEAFELLAETNADLRSDLLLNLLRQRLRQFARSSLPASCQQNESRN